MKVAKFFPQITPFTTHCYPLAAVRSAHLDLLQRGQGALVDRQQRGGAPGRPGAALSLWDCRLMAALGKRVSLTFVGRMTIM